MQILAIIPARGGSKGIHLKNIRKVAGKPLIEYTISSAKKAKLINRVIISTDDKKIATISKSLGAEVPFMRPKILSADDTSTIDVIRHTLDFLNYDESYKPDIVIVLQPTSPFRTADVIDKSIRMLINSKASCVLGVSRTKSHPYSSFWHDGKYLKSFKSDFGRFYQRQKYPLLYHPNGMIYTFWNATLEKYGTIYGPRILPLIIDTEDAVDVDDRFDMFIAEMKMLYWNNYKKRFPR